MTDERSGPRIATAARVAAILVGFGVLAVAPTWSGRVASLALSSLASVFVFLFGVWLLRRSAASPDFVVAAWLLMAAVSAGLWFGYLERDDTATPSAVADALEGSDRSVSVGEESLEDTSLTQFLCPSGGVTAARVFAFESGSVDVFVAVAINGALVAQVPGSASSVSATHVAYADANDEGRVVVEPLLQGTRSYSRRFEGIVTATAIVGAADDVFVLTNDLGRTEISSWDPRSNEVTRFYTGRAEVSSLAVSADGSKVAWSEGPRSASRVVIAETSIPVPVDLAAGRDPSWSVSGESLVYSSDLADTTAILGIDIASLEIRRLTEPFDQVHAEPALNSDCTKLVYVSSEADGSVDLWELEFGGEITELASGDGVQHNPSFGLSK